MNTEKNIKDKDAFSAYKEDKVRYTIAVNRRRAIPDIKDSFKPVQRRLIQSMFELRTFGHSSQRKCAKIVGDCTGNYHPHGTTSAYEAMMPIANPWQCKIPLIDPDGNFGNVKGDPAAAERYTEAALSLFCQECIIGELFETDNVVDWIKTYDEKGLEPEYFPTKVPLLLVNGCTGIGVGIATDIPPHNLKEVIDATVALVDAQIDAWNKSIQLGYEVDPVDIPIVLIPDQCSPCKIIDTDWEAISKSGNGSYKARGIVDIEDYKGYPSIIIKSLPDKVSTSVVTDKLDAMMVNKELPMVRDIIDSSAYDTVKIIIQLKKGSDPYFVRDLIYKRTAVESPFTVNFEVVDGLDTVRMNYKQYLEMFIASRLITKFRLYANRLQKVMTRYHKLDAYIKAIESGDIDNIISMIRKQKTTLDNDLVEYLIKKLNITNIQAKFIIDIDIRHLSNGYLVKYKQDFAELTQLRSKYEKFILDKGLLLQELKTELLEIGDKYGRPRLCKVIKSKDDSSIPKGTFKLIITENNYVRKILETDKATPVRGDNPKFIKVVDNQESVLLFDNKGRVYKLPVHKIPVTERSNPGLDIRLVIKSLTADIIAVIYEPVVKAVSKLKDKHFVTVITEGNFIKKLDILDFLTVPLSGIIYAKLADGDFVKSVDIISDKLDIIVYSEHKALRLPMNDVPNYKRASAGNKAMATDDKLGGLSVVYPNSTHVLVLTTSGKINKFNIEGLERSSRYKAGSTVIKLGKGDEIKAIYGVNDTNVLRVVMRESTNPIDINVADIASTSSVSPGVKMINTKSDKIIESEILVIQ